MRVIRGEHDSEGYLRLELTTSELERLYKGHVVAETEGDGTRLTLLVDEPAQKVTQLIGAASSPSAVEVLRARPGYDYEPVCAFPCTGKDQWSLDEAVDWAREGAREGIDVRVHALYRARDAGAIVCMGCGKPKPQDGPGWRRRLGSWWCPDCAPDLAA